MKLTEAVIAWNPGTDQIQVGAWPDRTGWSGCYRMATGACDAALHKLSPETQTTMLFIHFNTLVVRDGVHPQAAHHAFLVLDEYRKCISPDLLGADAAGRWKSQIPLASNR